MYGLVIDVSKSQFGRDTIDFLGHHITHAGVMPLPNKVDAITQFKQPVGQGLARICGHGQFLLKVHPSCCTDDAATL